MGYLDQQLITYLGNKRKLLGLIESALDQIDGNSFLDLFSGSGVVSRLAKNKGKYSKIIANDLEGYSYTINRCYLSNITDFNEKEYIEIKKNILSLPLKKGFISELYAPENSDNILKDERCFYTTENAMKIDTWRQAIEDFCQEEMKPFFIAPLLSECSIHANTSGVFKGFYKNKLGIGQWGGQGKNALERICGDIHLNTPILSEKKSDFEVFNLDAKELSKKIEVDIAYLDPPYNQHPYGSNYFMLNLINDYLPPEKISKVSGIPANWNRSVYNKKSQALNELEEVVRNLQARYILISYNNEGFISFEEMLSMLEEFGEVSVSSENYPTFRGSRNLKERELKVIEYLFCLKKSH